MNTVPSKYPLPADERIWPLKKEVFLARGKCDIQVKEEKAIHVAIRDAIANYKKETLSLGEKNMEDRKHLTSMLAHSSEEAEEILIRKCPHGQTKVLKYRGKDAETVSKDIGEEVAFLQNVLNNLTNKKKQRMQALMDQQRYLAVLEVNLETGADQLPEERQRCRVLECEIEKIQQKTACSETYRHKYEGFIGTLKKEQTLFEGRLNKLQYHIQQDIDDLEACHDIMMKGHILEYDANVKLVEQEAEYVEQKKERENEGKNMKKEVSRKDIVTSRKKVTLADVDLDKVLKEHQNMFAQLQLRRRTMLELDSWTESYSVLQDITRATDPTAVTLQFERQIERCGYLNHERERVETLRQQCTKGLDKLQALFSSVGHTGADAQKQLENRVTELKDTVAREKSRLEQAESHLQEVGTFLSTAKGSVKQQLRNLKVVSRPHGWTRSSSQSDTVGDLELLRLKILSLQDRFDVMGAPIRLESRCSIRSEALAAGKNQYRVFTLGRPPATPGDMGGVDEIEIIRKDMKNQSIDFCHKMTRKGRKPR